MAVSSAGDATVVWDQAPVGGGFVIEARRIAADGTVEPTLDVSAADEIAGDPAVAIDAAGTATVLWLAETTGALRARRIAPDGTLGPIMDLSAPGDKADRPRVAVDGTGVATAVWRATPMQVQQGDVVQARRIASDGTLGPTFNLSDPGGAGFYDAPLAATDRAGTTTLAWDSHSGPFGTVAHLLGRRIAPDGALGPIEPLSPPIPASSTVSLAVHPDLAEVGADATILVWENLGDPARPIIQARRITSNGTLGRVRSWSSVANPPGPPGPEVMLDGDANGAVIVWHERRRSTGTIQARRIASNGSLGPIQTLSAPGAVASPQVAVGAGTATAVWTGSHRVQGRHFRYR